MKIDKKIIIRSIIGFVIVGISYGCYQYFHQLPEGLIQVNGRIEGNEVSIASKVPGKIDKMIALEGQTVKAGDILATFELKTAKAKLDQAKAALLKSQAVLNLASKDSKRFNSLANSGAIDRHKGEQASVEFQVSEANQLQAQAVLDEAQSIFDDMTIKAPSDGTITVKVRENGEVIPAGAPLYTLVNMESLYLKVYVPENLIGKVKVGEKAQIFVDAFPDKPFLATVKSIASMAEFTPKEVQTKDERVKLVYAVKLYLDENPEHRLTPGMPADAIIKWKEDVGWRKPSW